MNKQSDHEQKNNKPTTSKIPQSRNLPSQPKVGSPMEKFNNALQKILSVPKKNIKKK